MRQKLNVATCPRRGLVCTRVPGELIWDLVEYLACQRARVEYTFDSESFTVYFLSTPTDAAQQLLNEWANAASAETYSDDNPHAGHLLVGAHRLESFIG